MPDDDLHADAEARASAGAAELNAFGFGLAALLLFCGVVGIVQVLHG